MTASEREAFLADLHVGVLSVARDDGGPPLAAPIWYSYEPGGDIVIVSGRDHEKTRLAAAFGTASLCAQTESMPYAFVTVSGPVTVADDATRELRLAMATRYLGDEMGAMYVEATDGEDAVTLRITPERWRTTDYAKL